MKQQLFSIIFILFFSAFCKAQITEDELLDSLIDEVLSPENELIDDLILSLSNLDLVYISSTYNSATYFAGRDLGYNQYNISPQITYANSNGIYGGVGGSYFSEFNPKWDVTIAFVGYANTIGKSGLLNYNVGFAKYFYTNKEDDIFGNAIDVGFVLRNKKRWIGTQLTGTYLFGEENSYQLMSKSFLNLQLLQTPTTTLKFKPSISFIAGKQTYLTRQSEFANGVRTIIVTEHTVFDRLNSQIQLPLECRFGNFDIESGYTINFPHSLQKNIQLSSNGFLFVSIGYLILL